MLKKYISVNLHFILYSLTEKSIYLVKMMKGHIHRNFKKNLLDESGDTTLSKCDTTLISFSNVQNFGYLQLASPILIQNFRNLFIFILIFKNYVIYHLKALLNAFW